MKGGPIPDTGSEVGKVLGARFKEIEERLDKIEHYLGMKHSSMGTVEGRLTKLENQSRHEPSHLTLRRPGRRIATDRRGRVNYHRAVSVFRHFIPRRARRILHPVRSPRPVRKVQHARHPIGTLTSSATIRAKRGRRRPSVWPRRSTATSRPLAGGPALLT